MDNYELLQLAAKKISRLIRLEKAWRDGHVEIDGDVVATFGPATQTLLKQKFATIRSDCIEALNGVAP